MRQDRESDAPLRIICIEEHLADPAITKAAAPALQRTSPYWNDLGKSFHDDPTGVGDRPGSVPPQQAARLTGEPIAERLAVMDAAGIDMQVLSYALPTQAVPIEDATDLARAANDRLAAIAATHPERFAGFATLPWQDPAAAVRELERVSAELGLTAVLLAGRPGEDVLIDDPRFASVLAALERLRMPLYIHPGPPMPAAQQAYYAGFAPEVTARLSLYGWGWHHEAGIQVVRLILSGVLDRHPDLRIISGHWGEMVPFYLQRLDDTMPRGVTGLSRTIGETYRDQVHVTPSGMLNLPHFRFCLDVLGADRILFAVDYPYLTMTGARDWIEALPVDDADRAKIAHGNAERLLRLV